MTLERNAASRSFRFAPVAPRSWQISSSVFRTIIAAATKHCSAWQVIASSKACRAGRIGAPSQPEYFTCLSGRVVLKDWFKVPIGPTRRAAHTHSGHEHIGGDCGGTDDFCHGCQRVSASNRYLGSSGGLLGVFAEKLIKSMAIGGDGRV